MLKCFSLWQTPYSGVEKTYSLININKNKWSSTACYNYEMLSLEDTENNSQTKKSGELRINTFQKLGTVFVFLSASP